MNSQNLLAICQQLFLSIQIWIFVFNVQVSMWHTTYMRSLYELCTNDELCIWFFQHKHQSPVSVMYFSSTSTSRPFQLDFTRSGYVMPNIYNSCVRTLTSIRFWHQLVLIFLFSTMKINKHSYQHHICYFPPEIYTEDKLHILKHTVVHFLFYCNSNWYTSTCVVEFLILI